MRFSNGDHISRGGGDISPRSAEGNQIETILERQRQDREANAAQRELFWRMTHAKNAAEAQRILADAKARDPNAGTPNVIQRHGKAADAPEDDDPAFRFSNGKRFSAPDGKLIRADSPQGREIEAMLAQQQRPAEERAQPASDGAGAPASRSGDKRVDVMRFSNGDRISRKDGSAIDPGSREGRQIEAILQRQRQDRAANAAQKELFWKITNAKNASDANAILNDAQRKDPNAGTPNVTRKTGPAPKRR